MMASVVGPGSGFSWRWFDARLVERTNEPGDSFGPADQIIGAKVALIGDLKTDLVGERERRRISSVPLDEFEDATAGVDELVEPLVGRDPAVAAAGRPAQGRWRRAANQDRDGPLHRERGRKRNPGGQGEVPADEDGFVLCPQNAHGVDELVGDRASVLIVGAAGIEGLFQPADPGAKGDPPAGEDIGGGQGFGGEHGVAIGDHEDADPEPAAAGSPGEVAQGGDGLVDGRAGADASPAFTVVVATGVGLIAQGMGHARGVRKDEMISDPQCVKADLLATIGQPLKGLDTDRQRLDARTADVLIQTKSVIHVRYVEAKVHFALPGHDERNAEKTSSRRPASVSIRPGPLPRAIWCTMTSSMPASS